jgi:hypothetical protein
LVVNSFFLLGSSLELEEATQIQVFLAEVFKNAEIEKGNFWLPSLCLRLAFHDAGTWRSEEGNGGPGSAISHKCVARNGRPCESNDEDNKGLTPAIEFLEGVLERFSDTGISRADVWQLAANVAIEVAGGPHLSYSWGRDDRPAPGFAGRLPKATLNDFDAIRDHLGEGALDLTDEEIVAVQGAHTLGFLHKKNSGFAGQWDGTPTLWDTEYFKGLSRVHNGFWPTRSTGARHLVLSSHLMLPTDIASFVEFPNIVRKMAKDLGYFNKKFASGWKKIQNAGLDLEEINLRPIPDKFIKSKPKHCKGLFALVCTLTEFRGHGPNGNPWERPLQNLHKIFPQVVEKLNLDKIVTYPKKIIEHFKPHVEKIVKHVRPHVKKLLTMSNKKLKE